MRLRKLLNLKESGFILPAVLSFIVLILIIAGALLEIVNTNLGNINNNVKSQQAFNIAEAAIICGVCVLVGMAVFGKKSLENRE